MKMPVHSQIVSNCQNLEFRSMLDRGDTKERLEVRFFLHSVQQASKRILKIQV